MNSYGFAVAAIILSLALSACSDEKNDTLSSKMGWQTYCGTPIDASPRRGKEFTVDKIGRPSKDIRSGLLIVANGELRVQDIPNFKQYKFDGGSFDEAPPLPCPQFQAYGWQINLATNGLLQACQFSVCDSIEVKPRTLIFSVTAANGSIFVGTSFGEALLYRDRTWCRMVNVNDVYSCDGSDPPIPDQPSNQFYSSTVFQGDALIGEYPSGRIFEFDGETVKVSDISPPQFKTRGDYEFESQTLAAYCGNLFVGYWPHGEIYRYDGKKWHEPVRLFTTEKSPTPFEQEAVKAGLVANFFGQRVSSLVPYQGALYALTANKGDWRRSVNPDIPKDTQDEYGVVYRISGDSCS
ncbi:MAG: hypothetical protein WBA48_03525 [Xanthobacteraceae bacterium]